MKITAFLSIILVTALFYFSGCKKNSGGNVTAASMHNSTASKKMGGACQSCHTSGGTAKGWWTAAGTIYTEDYSTVYPNATINFYTGPNGTGNLIGTLEVDAEGNFYSSTLALPAEGYYPQVVGTTGNILNMPQLCLSGNCNACHGVTSAKIWIN